MKPIAYSPMGRIITQVAVTNMLDFSKTLHLDALVDTGASHLILPLAWKHSLGELRKLGDVEGKTATQATAHAEIYGPVEIRVAGFRPVAQEVMFMEMQSVDNRYEPLLGYLPLEAIPVAVDMLGHRLVPVKALDCK